MKRFAVFALAMLMLQCAKSPEELTSPDGKIKVSVYLNEFAAPAFQVFYDEQQILQESTIGFELADTKNMYNNFKMLRTRVKYMSNVWQPVADERASILDNYTELRLYLQELEEPQRKMDITFRIYNEGVAYCTNFPQQQLLKDFTITQEKSIFNFVDDDSAWVCAQAQSEYHKMPLSQITTDAERPLVIEHASGICSALAEARLVDYARARLKNVDGATALQTSLFGPVQATTPFATPWRVLFLAPSAAQLLQQNYLLQNLNPPCALEKTDWIKPGKVIREVTLTDAGAQACIDFAVENNYQYVEFDAGWYGYEYADSSDATTITIDPKRSSGPLDLQHWTEYAHERNIGIIVYVNRRALERQLDELLPLYRKWGIDGIKYGFVDVGSRQATKWLYDAVAKAAKYGFMVDVHDEYRPTGTERTWPNFMTMEGIRGDEEMPTTQHDLITAFCRGLAGRGDHTICYFSNRIKARHAAQLAKSVIFFSPWQFLHWYDRPAEIYDAPELKFWQQLPTVWDDTKIIAGEISKYIITARRSGDTWFVGSLTDYTERQLECPLDFLGTGKYKAEIYEDGDVQDGSRTHVNKIVKTVTREQAIILSMPADGGCAVRITPLH